MKYVFSIFLILLTSLSLHAGEEVGKLVYIRGNVEILRNEQTLEAKKEQTVLTDDLIITDESSLAIISYKNGSKIKVDAKSQVHLKKIVDDGAPEGGLKLNLLMGSFIMNFINPNKEQSISVEAKNIAMGVRGTRFFMGIDDQNLVNTAVEKGEVEVFNSLQNDSEAIKAGRGIVFEKDGNITNSHTYDFIKRMNWSTDGRTGGSKFRDSALRKSRMDEFNNNLSSLRNRKRKNISNKLMKRLEKRKMSPEMRERVQARLTKGNSKIARKWGWAKKQKKKKQKSIKQKKKNSRKKHQRVNKRRTRKAKQVKAIQNKRKRLRKR